MWEASLTKIMHFRQCGKLHRQKITSFRQCGKLQRPKLRASDNVGSIIDQNYVLPTMWEAPSTKITCFQQNGKRHQPKYSAFYQKFPRYNLVTREYILYNVYHLGSSLLDILCRCATILLLEETAECAFAIETTEVAD